MAEPKFKVGDTVYFTNGKYGEHECGVISVTTGYKGITAFIPFTEPIYEIRWKPMGGATVHESLLSSASNRQTSRPNDTAAANSFDDARERMEEARDRFETRAYGVHGQR